VNNLVVSLLRLVCQPTPACTQNSHARYVANALYQRAGINGGSSHVGRRTFITNLAKHGISVRVLQHLTNHANISTTHRYIDLRPSMLRNAVELV
jgi:integrase/recombinase XerD